MCMTPRPCFRIHSHGEYLKPASSSLIRSACRSSNNYRYVSMKQIGQVCACSGIGCCSGFFNFWPQVLGEWIKSMICVGGCVGAFVASINRRFHQFLRWFPTGTVAVTCQSLASWVAWSTCRQQGCVDKQGTSDSWASHVLSVCAPRTLCVR